MNTVPSWIILINPKNNPEISPHRNWTNTFYFIIFVPSLTAILVKKRYSNTRTSVDSNSFRLDDPIRL